MIQMNWQNSKGVILFWVQADVHEKGKEKQIGVPGRSRSRCNWLQHEEICMFTTV